MEDSRLNIHQVAARQRKTEALVNKLIENNFTIAHIELMLPEHWDVVADQAGVHGPSQTVNMVIREMYRIESMARATIQNRRKKREPVLAGGGPR